VISSSKSEFYFEKRKIFIGYKLMLLLIKKGDNMKKIIVLMLCISLILISGCFTNEQEKEDALRALEGMQQIAQNAEVLGEDTEDVAPWEITVSDEEVSFSLVPVADGRSSSKTLIYDIVGPKFVIEANQMGTVDLFVEVYDDNDKLVSIDKTSLFLKKGKDIYESMKRTARLEEPGRYKLVLKIEAKDGTSLYSNEFKDILVGATSYPIEQNVEITPLNIDHKPYNLGSRYSADTISLDAKATNTGNSDILGYYRIRGYLNGNMLSDIHSSSSVQTQWYIGNSIAIEEVPKLYGYTNSGNIFLSRSAPGNEKLTLISQVAGDVLKVTCSPGDKLDLEISFISVNLENPNAEGTILATEHVLKDCIGQ
jgi:hypothetical protein